MTGGVAANAQRPPPRWGEGAASHCFLANPSCVTPEGYLGTMTPALAA